VTPAGLSNRLATYSAPFKFVSSTALSVAYTVAASDIGKLLVCSGTWTLALPAAASAGAGFVIAIYNTSSGLITIDPNGSEAVDGQPISALYQSQGVILTTDGAAWYIVGRSAGASGMAFSPSFKPSYLTLSNNNKTVYGPLGHVWESVRAINAIPAGKYYFEVSVDTAVGNPCIGIASDNTVANWTAPSLFGSNYPAGYIGYRSDRWLWGSTSQTVNWGPGYSAGNVVGVAIDTQAGKVWFAVNNVWQASGNPVAGTSPAYAGLSSVAYAYYPAIAMYLADGACAFTLKTSPSELTYAPPGGFATL